MKRTVRTAAVSLLSVLALSACGSGPVQTGAAATVGDDRIATVALEQVVERGLSDPQAAEQLGADRPAFQRQVLSRLITGQLLRTAAAARDVEVTDGEVDARIAEFSAQLGGRDQLETQAAQSGIAPQDLRPFLRDLTLNDKLADALTAQERVSPAQLQSLYQQRIAQFDQVVARHILLQTQAEAQQVLAQVRRDPAQFAQVASTRSLDEGSKARGGELDPAGRGAYVPEFEQALFSAREGQFGVVQTQFGFHVYQLLERRTTSLQEATPVLRREALQAQRETAIASLLRETAQDERVRVNPRFGSWDSETVQVVEAPTQGGEVVSSPAPDGESDAAPLGEDPLAPQGEQPQGPEGEQPQQEVAPEEQQQEQAPQQAPASPTQ